MGMGIPILEQVTVGNLIEIGVIGVGWIVTIVKIDQRLKSVEKDIKDVISLMKWRERMEERTDTLRRDVDDLRRGKGFVIEDIQGEWSRRGKIKPEEYQP